MRTAVLLVLWRSACTFTPVQSQSPTPLPRPDHIVVVIEENHSYSESRGSPAGPYINSLVEQGALLTRSFAVAYPSQPTYLVLFSGSTQGVIDNSCPHTFSAPNLRSKLSAAGLTFGGYSEDLPSIGLTVCDFGTYVRRHNPWVNWQGASANAVLAEETCLLHLFQQTSRSCPL